jgi:hypothetical protein
VHEAARQLRGLVAGADRAHAADAQVEERPHEADHRDQADREGDLQAGLRGEAAVHERALQALAQPVRPDQIWPWDRPSKLVVPIITASMPTVPGTGSSSVRPLSQRRT